MTTKSLLTKNFPQIQTLQKVSEARKDILESADSYDTLTYIYVTSEQGALKGVLSIQELLTADPQKKISAVMSKKLITAHTKDKPQVIAHLALKNSLKAVPVIDSKDKIIGILSADSIQKILHQETQKKLLHIAGIVPNHFNNTSALDITITKAFLSRLPWILVGLLGGLLAASVIESFSDTLSRNIILASFIPLVAYLANAVGTQTQTLFIRDLSHTRDLNFPLYLLKQIITAFLLGLSCLLLIILITTLIWNNSFIGLIIGLSVLAAILVASFFALVIPYLLDQLKLDPAIGSGPFATIIQDLLSIIIYFLIASRLI